MSDDNIIVVTGIILILSNITVIALTSGRACV